MPPSSGEGMSDSPPPGGLSTSREPGAGARTRPPRLRRTRGVHQPPLRPEQPASSGVDVKDLRPLRGRPFGSIPDPDASTRRAQMQAENGQKKDQEQERGVDRPRFFRDELQETEMAVFRASKDQGAERPSLEVQELVKQLDADFEELNAQHSGLELLASPNVIKTVRVSWSAHHDIALSLKVDSGFDAGPLPDDHRAFGELKLTIFRSRAGFIASAKNQLGIGRQYVG